MSTPDIYTYVKEQEASFETEEIKLGDNWNWNLRNHVQLIFHLKNGVFFSGENNWMRAFKNIMEPLLNLAYWTEDIDVKDIVFFVEGKDSRALSFLIKKYHDEVYVRENNLDTLLDEITESDIDYGGVLVQKTNTKRPEVLPLTTIAFCDQRDVLGAPIGFKFAFSAEGLRKMKKNGWGDTKNGATISIEDLIVLAGETSSPAGMQDQKQNKSSGKVIEVYVIRGNMPDHYLNENDDMETVTPQVQVIAYYTDKKNKKQGVTLYKKAGDEDDLMFFTSKAVDNRGLGRGVGESLLHPQIWTNFLTIHKTQLLQAAAKVPLVTDDDSYKTKNTKIQDMENLEITVIEQGTSLTQVPTAATANIQLFDKAVDEWFQHSQTVASAYDPLLGKEQVSGTTFKGQERTVAQGRGLHDRRRGQRAKFIEHIYRKLIIPQMVREIIKGEKFLATLTPEEMTWVSDQLLSNHINSRIKEGLLKGRIISLEEQDMLRSSFKEAFSKSGNRHLIEILKEDFKDRAVSMGINIAGKQKDLVMMSDKILSIFQFIFANPQGFQQAMQIPVLAKSFHDILEYSGMSQVDFASLMQPIAQTQATQPGNPSPMVINPQPVA